MMCVSTGAGHVNYREYHSSSKDVCSPFLSDSPGFKLIGRDNVTRRRQRWSSPLCFGRA